MTLTELRERADRATPGPRIRPWGSDQLWAPGAHGIFDYGVVGPTQAQRNLDFAAACSPEVIKALVAVAVAAENAEQHYVVDPDSPYVHLEADCCGDAMAVLWAALDALREALA